MIIAMAGLVSYRHHTPLQEYLSGEGPLPCHPFWTNMASKTFREYTLEEIAQVRRHVRLNITST